MEHKQLSVDVGFSIVGGTDRSQAAVMVLKPGETAGGPRFRHPESDKWVLVLDGEGRATVGGRTVDIGPRSLLLILPGEGHEIVNTGESPLETVSFYAPRVY